MTTVFEDWLGAMARAGKGPVLLSATRGNAFKEVLGLDADLTGATFAGKIRARPDAPDPALATLSCSLGSYDSGTGTTPLTLSLTGAETAALPAAPTGEGVIQLAYTVEMTFGGLTDVLFGGTFELMGSIT